jgi:hypothetical protein
MGSLNGGKTKEYLDLIRTCMENVKADYDKGLIAIFHDESHLNCYLNKRQVLGLSPSYGYPEELKIPFQKKIIMLEKTKVDLSFAKTSTVFFLKSTKRRVVKLYDILFW